MFNDSTVLNSDINTELISSYLKTYENTFVLNALKILNVHYL